MIKLLKKPISNRKAFAGDETELMAFVVKAAITVIILGLVISGVVLYKQASKAVIDINTGTIEKQNESIKGR